MRILVGVALSICLALPLPVLAADQAVERVAPGAGFQSQAKVETPDSSVLLASATRAGARLALQPMPPAAAQDAAAAGRKRSWISRHPALFGTLVGAGAGAVAAGTMENELFCSGGDEDCFFHGGSRVLVGAGFGAGIGALAGWIGSLGSK